jgi:hypothetical protein
MGLFPYLTLTEIPEVYLKTLFLIIWFILGIFIVFFGVLSTYIDPTDPNVYYEKELKKKG